MKHSKMFKLAAASRGFDFWWDPSLNMWALTKEGVNTEYFSTYILNQLAVHEFIRVYLPLE